MVQQAFDQEMSNRTLERVRVGMDVYDRDDHQIGKVDDLYMGATSKKADERGKGSATAPNPNMRENEVIEDIARAIAGGEEIPEELRQRLLREGYIRLDTAGLFAAHRYILPDQIAHVEEDHVHLRVTREELIRR